MATSEPMTTNLYNVLSVTGADPKSMHAALDELRGLAGENVVTEINARITAFEAKTDARISAIDARITAFEAKTDSKLDVLQQQGRTIVLPLVIAISASLLSVVSAGIFAFFTTQ